MYENNEWKLTPAYDLTFAYNPESYWLKNHNINVNGKSNNITQDDLVFAGEKFGIKKTEKIISHIREIISNFGYYANKYQYPAAKTERINNIINKNK